MTTEYSTLISPELDEYKQLDTFAHTWLADRYSKLVVPPKMKMIRLIIVTGAKANSAQRKNSSALRY